VFRLLRGITPRSLLLRTHSPIPSSSPLLWFVASFEESLQIATSLCCSRDLPDVISAILSSDAWPSTPTVPPSALACFFLGVIGLPYPDRPHRPVACHASAKAKPGQSRTSSHCREGTALLDVPGATTGTRPRHTSVGFGLLARWKSFIELQIELQYINSRFSEYPKLPAFCVFG
jgi:hypothetical protein